MNLTKLILFPISLLALICCQSVANSNNTVLVNSDTAKQAAKPVYDKTKPIYKAEIEELTLESKGERFVGKEIRFFNRGSQVLKIDSLVSSCNCLTSKVTLGNVQAMGYGILVVNVNVNELASVPSKLELKVYTNAVNSPVTLPIIVK